MRRGQRLAGGALLAAGVTLACGACQAPARAWVVKGSTADRLAIGLSASADGREPFPLRTLEVYSCARVAASRRAMGAPTRQAAEWYVDQWPRDPAHAPPGVTGLVYGQVPQGMTEDLPAQSLRPLGCYVVQAYGAEGPSAQHPVRAALRVGEDGVVQALTEAQLDSLFRASRALAGPASDSGGRDGKR